MVHAKFQDHVTSGFEEKTGHFMGHLGHVTWTIYINFHSIFLRQIHIKFGFDWP